MNHAASSTDSPARISTGIPGLNTILCGGLLSGRSYLVRGGPGTGKTLLGLHFLTTPAEADSRSKRDASLYITLGEPEMRIRHDASAMGFDLSTVSFLSLAPEPDYFTESKTYDLFDASEVERRPATEAIVERIEELSPSRIVIDSMTHFRYLAANPTQFRKQTLSLLQYLTSQGATVVFTSESSPEAPDQDLQFLSDGVIELEQSDRGRILSVTKFRGSSCVTGPHSMRIDDSGLAVFPRLVPSKQQRTFANETISSGVPELDELLHGGLERGTSSIISGPSGVGKTTLGLQFMKEAAGRGERSVIYNFEEETETLLHRCESINIPVRAMVERGTLAVKTVRAWTHLPDEFTEQVRQDVEENDTRIVMIDSLAGFRHCFRSEDVTRRLIALGKYLVSHNITVLMVEETPEITGDFRATEAEVSHLADNLLFMRHLEVQGELRKAIGVLKKRASDFEKTLRRFSITQYGLKVGEPLTGLRGVLRGTPEWTTGADSEETSR